MHTHLSGRVNLSLPRVLALAKHRRRQKLVAVLPAHEVRRLEEDGGAIVPRQGFPFFLRSERAIDGSGDRRLVRFMVRAEVFRVVRGERLLRELASPDLRDDDRSEIGGSRAGITKRTSLPFTIQGTSKGSSFSICARASTSFLRSTEPGA